MCPEFFKTSTRRPHEVSLNLCRANDMQVIAEFEIERTCRNNCTSCFIYQRKHGRKPPSMVQPYDTKPKSSGGIGGLIVLGLIVAVILKVIGVV